MRIKTKIKKKRDIKRKGIFTSQLNHRGICLLNYDDLKPFIKRCRQKRLKLVLTSGTFDMIHIGHARYLEAAKKCGDVLIVGVDSDKKVRLRKGPERPVVPEEERMEMLSHLKGIDAVVLKKINYPKWSLIKLIRPDVLITTGETYTPVQVEQLKEFCGKVTVLNPMATTSTSAKVRRLQISLAVKLENSLTPKLFKAIKQTFKEFKN